MKEEGVKRRKRNVARESGGGGSTKIMQEREKCERGKGKIKDK